MRDTTLQQRKIYLDKFYRRMLSRLTVDEIAEKTDVSRNTLYSWKTRGIPDPVSIVKIAEAMNVSACWLAFEHGPEDRQAAELGSRMAAAIAQIPSERRDAIVASLLNIAGIEMPKKEVVKAKAVEPVVGAAPAKQEAWQEILKMGLKSKDFDAKKVEPTSPMELPVAKDLRAAADHNVVGGSGIPHIHDTVPVNVKYDRKTHFTLKVTGRSMHPTIFEGDRIIVKRVNYFMPIYDEDRGSCDPQVWKSMDKKVVVALLDDDFLSAVIKRLEVTYRKDTGFKLTLLSDNRGVKSIEILKQNSLRVIGVVQDILRSPDNFE